MKILSFGSLNIDYVYFVPHFVKKGETLSAKELNVYTGGKGLNQSIALARAGVETYQAGAIGTDGMFLLEQLKEAGVKTDLVKILDDVRTGNAIIQNDDEGDNCIVLFGGANQAITKEQVDEVFKDFTNEDITVVPRWYEMSISQQFYEVEYNGSKYTSNITKISDNNILSNIGNTTLTGYDTYTENAYSKKGNLFSIKDISEKCAIAIKFEGDTDYYVYVNSYYRPKTLGEFIEDLNLKENISFETIYYNYWDKDTEENINIEFYDVDNEIIWQKLFNNLNLENIYSDNDTSKYTSEKFSESIQISVDIALLGYKNISISLTDKGYLLTNILDTGKGFYIGEEKVQEFLNYIKENYDGYQIIHVDENGNKIDKENNESENSVVVMENNTKDECIIDTIITTENIIKTEEN